ncbi:adenylosuccinate synthetase-like [Triplophysa rosa]|uniref:adenylosuccinate synthetase-like n=1 Tax=Triplophysa rosa TaxID=992332 RepID=UPI0025462A26|nr:adenylosuccinate synthetase-like [Triplophysa rosa]
MAEIRKSNCHVLFEGAQGIMLDLNHGTYPYVTSSNTVTGSVLNGSGVSYKMIDFVLGITKAYSTRVGSGPFPTEFLNDEQDLQVHIGGKGKEVGTNTGRLRRCGWFDAVAVKQAVNVAGIDGIALTKLDILDELDEIKICIGYELDNQIIDYLPSSSVDQFRVKPIYETIKGWKSNTQSMKSWIDIPLQANKYVRRIEELIGVPVTLLSTSPKREDTICVHDPFLI